jgi:hypothetical protein
MPPALSLAALLLLAAPVSAPVTPPPAADAPVPRPSGDEALLRSMKEAHLGLLSARSRAHFVLGELNGARYQEKLAKLTSAPGEAGARAEAVRVRLVTAWQALYQAVAAKQPIDPRAGCRLQERTLSEALEGSPGSAAAGWLPGARSDARACLGRLSAMLELARTRLTALDAAIAEAKAQLAAEPPGPPAGR